MDLHSVKIRRDANTITPVDIPEHELPIVQAIFGEENVQNAQGLSIAEEGLGKVVATVKTPDDEYGRLCAKYGTQAVEDVYGKKASGALETKLERIAEKKAKAASAKPSAGLKLDEIKDALAKREITIPDGVTKKEDLAKLLDESEAPAE